MARKEFGCGNGLDGLAQAHLVADQRAAGARGEQRAFGLVGVELDLQQLGQAPCPPRLWGRPRPAPARRRSPSRICATNCQTSSWQRSSWPLSAAARSRSSRPSSRSQGSAQPAAASNSCRACCQQRRRAALAGTKAHMSSAGIVEPDLAVLGLETARQRGLAAALLGQAGERELDVLAGAQVVGREVGAAAEVAAQRAAADGHAVARAALRVVHAEVGEHRFVPQVLQLEGLFAAELAAQGGLPVGGLQTRRAARARQPRCLGGSALHRAALAVRLVRSLRGDGEAQYRPVGGRRIGRRPQRHRVEEGRGREHRQDVEDVGGVGAEWDDDASVRDHFATRQHREEYEAQHQCPRDVLHSWPSPLTPAVRNASSHDGSGLAPSLPGMIAHRRSQGHAGQSPSLSLAATGVRRANLQDNADL